METPRYFFGELYLLRIYSNKQQTQVAFRKWKQELETSPVFTASGKNELVLWLRRAFLLSFRRRKISNKCPLSQKKTKYYYLKKRSEI